MHEKSNFTCQIPAAKIYELLIESSQKIKDWELSNRKRNPYTLTYKVNISLGSWGEKVIIKLLEDKNPELTRVEVHSRSVIPTTLFDYGKNRANIDTVKKLLNIDE